MGLGRPTICHKILVWCIQNHICWIPWPEKHRFWHQNHYRTSITSWNINVRRFWWRPSWKMAKITISHKIQLENFWYVAKGWYRDILQVKTFVAISGLGYFVDLIYWTKIQMKSVDNWRPYWISRWPPKASTKKMPKMEFVNFGGGHVGFVIFKGESMEIQAKHVVRRNPIGQSFKLG